MRIGLFTDAFPDRPLASVLDWVHDRAPEISEIEIGTGGYSPSPHCDLSALLADPAARTSWQREIVERGFRISALNVSGNPLHPNPEVANRHDRELRDTIRLAGALGIDRVVAMSGCPGAGESDRIAPHFAASAWLPDYEGIGEWQWRERVQPYWLELAELARREHPTLLICLELHPGTFAYNVESFTRMASVGPNVGVNLDPSHFFWQRIDPLAVVGRLGPRIGHVHGKDTTFNTASLAVDGLLDRRWPGPPSEQPWSFATVGRGHDLDWWASFVGALAAAGFDGTISLEQEDPVVPAQEAVAEASVFLGRAMKAAKRW